MVVDCNLLPAIEWLQLPESFAGGEGVVVRVQVSSHKKRALQLQELLQPAEAVRAKKYYKEEDQYRFLIARASLRILLGKYANQHPAKIEFVLGTNKKPLATNTPGLHYNISHCKDWILLAIAHTEVGVDVERVDELFPFEDILTDSFSLPEQRFIKQSPVSRQAFYQVWTRKEALVKATAQGIDADFSNVPALDGRHHVADSKSSSIADWTVSSFEAAPNYIAAIARPNAVPLSSLCFCEADEALFSLFCMG
jgi:4'-phosphopantetheinyl transferase